jgi:hypothetical protein
MGHADHEAELDRGSDQPARLRNESWAAGRLVAQARQLALLREPEPLHLVDQAPVVCGRGIEGGAA